MVAIGAAMLDSLYSLLPPPIQPVLIVLGCLVLGSSLLWSAGHLVGLL